MSSKWFIEELQSEDGCMWNILERQGKGHLLCVAQCLDEARAQQLLSALKWIDAMGGTMLSLHMEGITLNARTGLPMKPPRSKKLEIVVEPPKRRRARK